MLADPGPDVGTLGPVLWPADRDILRCGAGLLATALKPPRLGFRIQALNPRRERLVARFFMTATCDR